MDKRKIGKWILLLIAIIILFYFFKAYTLYDVGSYMFEWNLDNSQGSVLLLLFIYLVEIHTILILWNFLLHTISVDVSLLLDRISEYFLKKKKIQLSILCIRFKYGVSKSMFFLRSKWWRLGSSNDGKIVWNSINMSPIKDIIIGIGFFFISLPALIAILFTAISLEWFGINEIQNKWADFSNLEFDVWDAAKMLPPLTVVILVVFIWYFISFKGNIRRAIAQSNRKNMEDIIQKQRNLAQLIGDCLYPIALNLEYVINCQELLADLWIHSKFPNYEAETFRLRKYDVKEIPKLEIISQKFNELKASGNWSSSKAFSSLKYEFLTLMVESCIWNSKKLNEVFFTKESLQMIIDDAKQPMFEYSKEEISKMREDYLAVIPGTVVGSLTLLYKLRRYYDKMDKLLSFKSDKVGRVLRMFTGKE